MGSIFFVNGKLKPNETIEGKKPEFSAGMQKFGNNFKKHYDPSQPGASLTTALNKTLKKKTRAYYFDTRKSKFFEITSPAFDRSKNVIKFDIENQRGGFKLMLGPDKDRIMHISLPLSRDSDSYLGLTARIVEDLLKTTSPEDEKNFLLASILMSRCK